jgi:hypothetical protein
MTLSTTVQICTLLLRRLLLATEDLFIGGEPYSQLHRNDHNNSEWLDLLLPFTTVKNLHLSELFRHVSRSFCKTLLKKEQQKCCPLCKMLSWGDPGHQNLLRRALRSSFISESSLTTPSPFLSGVGRRRSMIDSCLFWLVTP